MFDKSLTYLFFKSQRVPCIYYILNFGGVHSFHRFDSYLFSASSFQTDLFESTLFLCHSIILIYHIGSPNGLFYKTCFQNLLLCQELWEYNDQYDCKLFFFLFFFSKFTHSLYRSMTSAWWSSGEATAFYIWAVDKVLCPIFILIVPISWPYLLSHYIAWINRLQCTLDNFL